MSSVNFCRKSVKNAGQNAFHVLCLCWMCCSLCGCSGPDFGHVQGVVLLDGKPLPDVEVLFMPVPSQQFTSPESSVYTDSQGEFSTEKSGRDGVLVGTHRVCLNDARVMMASHSIAADSGERLSKSDNSNSDNKRSRPRQRIPLRYSDVQQTPFRNIVIGHELQNLRFELQSE